MLAFESILVFDQGYPTPARSNALRPRKEKSPVVPSDNETEPNFRIDEPILAFEQGNRTYNSSETMKEMSRKAWDNVRVVELILTLDRNVHLEDPAPVHSRAESCNLLLGAVVLNTAAFRQCIPTLFLRQAREELGHRRCGRPVVQLPPPAEPQVTSPHLSAH